MTKAEELLAAARATGDRIATAESCTGGMIGAAITDVPGSSDIFDRGFISYSNAAKIAMLGVDPWLIETHGAVSEEVARAMADGALDRSHASLAVAVTGVAGPGASERKPEGRVCFALASTGRRTRSETVDFGAIGRAKVRRATVDHALDLLLAAVRG